MTYKLPEEWKEVKLGEIIDLTMGQSPKSEYYNEKKEGTPFLQGNSTFGIKYPEIERYTTKVTRLAKKGDILMSVRAPVGDLNISNMDICIGRGLCSMRMLNGQQEFLYYLMKYYISELKNRESGTVFSSINKKDIETLPINLPPLQEQKAIADTLSAIDDKIELNNKINQNLEAQAQAIFKSWFIDFEPFQDGEFVESELGMIPKGWEVVKLGDIISICNGKRPKEKVDIKDKKNKYPILGASGVMGYTNDYMYNEPILVIGRVGTHGVVQKVSDKVWTSDNTMIIKTTYYEFVNQVLLGLDYKSLNRGSTQPLLAQKDIKDQKIAIPYKNKDTLNLFENILSKYRRQIDSLEIQNQKLSQLRGTLLPKLMSGEIRIPLDE